MLTFRANIVIILLLCVSLALGEIRSDDHAIETIKTEDADVFKCIDINQQPALDHPLLKNHEIQMKPSSYPSELHSWALTEATNSMAQLPFVACPEGSIPILQDRKDGKIEISNYHPMDNAGKGELAGIKIVDDIYGSHVSINVYEPKVKEKTADFSASWVEMSNNENTSYYETIAAGSVVWPSLHGDDFARFHTTWYGKDNNACWDHRCPGFVQVSPSVVLGGRIHPVSTYNGAQYEIHVHLFKDPKTANWWLAYGKNKTPVGYWPASIFNHLKDKSNIAFWGGHLSGPTVQSYFPEMGSGHYASEGYGKAAFVRDIKIVDGNNMYVTPNSAKTIASSSKMTCYTVDKFGQDNDGMHVYYGGPGGCTN
ncbi:protein neprosin-like [Lolium perenne]|uniref:protein neprosin-like n=2 Tax=Lolium perenne TaxID=4522 RepID=UPI003A993DE2